MKILSTEVCVAVALMCCAISGYAGDAAGEGVRSLLEALRATGTSGFHAARHQISVRNNDWREALREFCENTVASSRDYQDAVRLLSTTLAVKELLPFYRRELVRATDRSVASSEAFLLAGAIAVFGRADDVAALRHYLDALLSQDERLSTEESYWPLTLVCLAVGEAPDATSSNLLAGVRSRIESEVRSDLARHGDNRIKGMAPHWQASVLFAAQYGSLRLEGNTEQDALAALINDSSEYRVRVAAMNVLTEFMEGNRDGAHQRRVFPCKSDWEMDEILGVHVWVLQKMGEGYGRIPYGRVRLADGREPSGPMSEADIQRESDSLRQRFTSLRSRRWTIDSPLSPKDAPSVLFVVTSKLPMTELTRDKRMEKPILGGYR